MSFIRNIWYVAAWSPELASVPIGRTLVGEPVVLWRTENGGLVAMEDRCPHRQAPLSLGRIEGESIRCMYHGLRFSARGTCLGVPGTDAIPPHSAVHTFPVVERHGWIWIFPGDPARADPARIPQAFGLDNPDWIMREGVLDYAADYQLINDNLTDLSHLDYVHEKTLRASSGADWSQDQPTVTMSDDGLLIERWFDDHPLRPDAPDRVDTFNSYRYLLPGLFLMHTRVYPPGTAARNGPGAPDGIQPIFERVEQQAVTPIADGRSRYFFATGIGAGFAAPGLIDAVMGVINAGFAEDRTMIEAQQRIWDLTPLGRTRAFIPQDKAPSIFRRLIARRVAAEAAGPSKRSIAAQ